MSQWNVIIFVYERDCDHRSIFAMDFANLIKFTKCANISVSIEYHSVKVHGNHAIYIREGKMTVEALRPITKGPKIVDAMTQQCRRHYDRAKHNVFIHSGHCYTKYLYSRGKRILLDSWADALERDKIRFDAVCFDCCYTSHADMLMMLCRIANYYIGTQSAGPDLGFLTSDLPRLICRADPDRVPDTLLRPWVHSFIRRNNRPIPGMAHYTSGVAVDLKQFCALEPDLKRVHFKPGTGEHARVEPDHEDYRRLKDLIAMLQHVRRADLADKVRETVLINVHSRLMHKQKFAKHLHGISTGVA